MRNTILPVLVVFAHVFAFGQQRTEFGAQAAVSNYFGDFSPKNVVSSQTSGAFGAFVRFDLRPNWTLRFNYLQSKIEGTDANFEAGSTERARGFSFENKLSTVSAIVEWYPFAKKRQKLADFQAGASPYLAVGHGLAFHNPKLSYNLEGNLGNEELSKLLEKDLRANSGKPAPIFHLGIGTKFFLTPKWSLCLDLAAQPALSDYLDGASLLGNPNKNDWQVIGAVQISYTFESKMEDRDHDGVSDQKDGCPDEPGKKRHAGCPVSEFGNTTHQKMMEIKGDSDGDGVPEPFDKCPIEPGNVVFNGCPDSDGDGLIDLMDKCPDFVGEMSLEGCPAEVYEMEEELVLDQDFDAIHMIFDHASEGIEFVSGSEIFGENVEAYLDNVASVMTNYPFLKVEIEGYPDNSDNPKFNLDLSANRAKKCVEYLVSQGVAAERLSFRAFGEAIPADENSTENGQENRGRVVFVVK